jgi:isopentenyl-diphosphate delta-isomerase type 1
LSSKEDTIEPEEEIFDIVDEQGRIRAQATRQECHADPRLIHRAVHVFVFNQDGDLFLQKRSLKKRIQPGKWDTSVGGHVAQGESFAAAALREMAEELGLKGLQPTWLHHYLWRSPVETELVHTFYCIHEGPFVLHPQEIEEGRFFSQEELRRLSGSGELTPNLEHELRLLQPLLKSGPQ